MVNSISGTTQTVVPEAVSDVDARLVQEWRQKILAQGIVPSAIDRYLLTLQEVPESVKLVIREQHKAAQNQELLSASAQAQVQGTLIPGAESASGAEIFGQVNVFDTKKQIEQIKKEANISQSTEQPPVLEGIAAEKKQTEIPVEVQMQPSENKDLPSTPGTLAADAGMAVRTSLGVSGYPPSGEIAANASAIAEKGPVTDAKTWQALLLQRFLELWGSFVGLFSTESKNTAA